MVLKKNAWTLIHTKSALLAFVQKFPEIQQPCWIGEEDYTLPLLLFLGDDNMWDGYDEATDVDHYHKVTYRHLRIGGMPKLESALKL